MAEAFFLPDGDPPTWRQRRLGMELRRLREAAGLGPHAAARLLNRTVSSLSKLENAQRGIRRAALEQILDKYDVTDPNLRESLFALARDAKKQGWWQTYADVLSSQMFDYISIEASSTRIWTMQLNLIPGLLQTPRYARAILSGGVSKGEPDHLEALIDIRLKRRAIFEAGEPPEVWAIVSEGALMQQVGGPEVMREQLDYLVEAATLPSVVLQVLPFAAGAHPGVNGSFVLMEVNGLWIAMIDSVTNAWYLEDQTSLNRYADVFNHLRAVSHSQEASLALIQRIRSET
ncbi:helix-turn-helix domain-containing protein [Actinocorallia lasiicapitis]